MILDDHLSFDEHITYIHNKATKKLGILYKSKDYLDRSTKILLYKSLILPHLDYCDTVYMTTTETNLSKLQKIQNVACRTILGANKEASIKQMHTELELLTLFQRRQLHQAMECFNNINNPEAGPNHMFNTVDDRAHNTRTTGTKVMKVPNIRTTTGRKAFSYRGPRFWNDLHSDCRQIDKKDTFKRHISKTICRDVNHPG